MNATDWRAAAVLGWTLGLTATVNVVADLAGLRWLQAVEWPTDLTTLAQLGKEPIDVAIVGSSRAHYGLPPSGIDLCLSDRLGRRTRTVGLNRLTASAYTEDIVARDLLAASPPRVLVVEVSPEGLNANHFEMDHNIASTAAIRDVPECFAHARSLTRLTSCARPLMRGVENVAHFFHRPWSDHAHLTWMALYAGGGQYCFDDALCRANGAAYDARASGRWEERLGSVVAKVRSERFVDYTPREGLAAEHFRKLLDREIARGVTVVVVNMPVATAYQAEVPVEVYGDFLSTLHDELTPRGVAFVDFNTPERQADRANWLDPDHLNRGGAERLTGTLCDETLVPLFLGHD